MDWGTLLRDFGPSMTFGGAAGLVVGYTAKKVAKGFALVLGLGFILIQVLSYYGFITVNWGGVEARATSLWMDSHGESLPNRFWEMLTSNLPFGGTFVAGFMIGFHKG